MYNNRFSMVFSETQTKKDDTVLRGYDKLADLRDWCDSEIAKSNDTYAIDIREEQPFKNGKSGRLSNFWTFKSKKREPAVA